MKNIKFKNSFGFLVLLFLSLMSNQIIAQVECDSLTKIIIFEPDQGVVTVDPPIISDPPTGDPEVLGPEDGDEYYRVFADPELNYQRHVFFVHGLEGNSDSWSSVRPWAEHGHGQDNFLGWKIKAFTPDYSNNQNNLYDAAGKLSEQLINPTQTDILPSDNIIIAHSMGGLVSRQMDLDYSLPEKDDKPYGGMITFGTPHLGSPAATYLYDNKHLLKEFLKNSCLNIVQGPAREFEHTTSNWFLRFLSFSNFFSVGDLTEDICNQDDFLTGLVEGMFSPIVQDLVPGNPVLNELNTYVDPNIQKMAFYGIEDDDEGQMTWSFAYSLRNDVNEESLFSAGDNNDFHAKQEKMMAQYWYSSKYEHWNSVYSNFFYYARCVPTYHFYFFPIRRVPLGEDNEGNNMGIRCLARKSVREIRDGYKAGRDYSYKLNDYWKGIIGSYNNPPTVIGYNCRYWEYHPNDGSYQEYTVEVNDPSECQQDSYYLGYEEIFGTTSEERSDGIVLESSAIAFPGVNFPPVKMDGSNHFQMRNDGNTKVAMEGIFYGNYLDWFWTPQRGQ